MTLMVRDVLNLPIFKTAKIKTGMDVLKHFHVDWISAIEGPVENFIRKDEFILTTGMGCENDPTKLLEFVRDVDDSGASALAIATGRFIFDIPDEVIQFAEERDFILIDLPWEIRFADILREVMDKINEEQAGIAARSSAIQQKLLDFVVQGKDLSYIVAHVEKVLDCSILFTDAKGRVKVGKSDTKGLQHLWDKLAIDGHPKELSEYEQLHHMQKLEHDGTALLQKQIFSGDNSQGNFIILFKKKFELTETDLPIIEHLAAAAALWISRENAIVETEIRLRNEFIWSLAKLPDFPRENIHSRAKLYGYNLKQPYACIVGQSENIDALSDRSFDYHESERSELKSILYYIEEEIRYAAKAVQRRVAFTFDEDQLIIFLEVGDEAVQGAVNHFLDLVEKRLNVLLPEEIFSWGIGKHLDGIMLFHESYKKAKSALDMGRKQKGPGNRVDFTDTRMNQLLLNLAHNDEVQQLTLETITPLIEYDKKRDMDLIETFIAYNKQNGNVSQTARILNLHRQSLLYRLRKIETLTNLMLMKPDDVFLLDFSIRVWSTGVLRK